MQARGPATHAPNHGGPGVCNSAACNSVRHCVARRMCGATVVACCHCTGRILCRKHQKNLVRGSDRAFATRLIFRDVRAVPISETTQ